jgi:hypothetical protein
MDLLQSYVGRSEWSLEPGYVTLPCKGMKKQSRSLTFARIQRLSQSTSRIEMRFAMKIYLTDSGLQMGTRCPDIEYEER